MIVRAAVGFAGCWLLLTISGCKPTASDKPSSAANGAKAERGLVEVTEAVGLGFVHDPGPLDTYDMPQIMGSGAALLDYDMDGDLDALLINGGPLRPDSSGQTPTGFGSRLFRQTDDGRFEDVTGASGLEHRGYGMGVAVGDMDNDGDVDLYLTNYGPDQLFENQGDGTFQDVTAAAGISNPQWGTAVAFVDYDLDGWLDLFVVNYVDFLPGSICEDGTGRRDYCGPEAFTGTVDKLYRNRGASPDGPRFEDVTVAAGLTTHAGKGLGVLCRDVTGDGLPDFYIANDMEDNCLWVQQPDGRFVNEAHLRGVAVNQFGEPEASMGVASGDVDADGHLDILLTHLSGETNTLYAGDAAGQFVDHSVLSGLGPPSRPYTGFGVALIDLEHDGDLDVVVGNGRVKRGPPLEATDVADFWRDYAEPNHVYRNEGGGRFAVEPPGGSSAFSGPVEVTRAIASGDIDNDGDIDLLVATCSGPARVYRNEYAKQGHWLLVRCVDPDWKRDAYGARVAVRADKMQWQREINPSSSYLSSNDCRAHFGLGTVAHIDEIRVWWPGATSAEVFSERDVDRILTLTRGTGQPDVAGAAAGERP